MEFKEMQEIWRTQNSRPLYSINDIALKKYVESKKLRSLKITRMSELLLIITYFVSAAIIFVINFTYRKGNIFMYVLVAWLLLTAINLLADRIRRIRGNHDFQRSLRGDLQHAIAVAKYQFRLSLISRWNILPVALLILLATWTSGKSSWVYGFIFGIGMLAFFAGNREHDFYKRRRNELEDLQRKLEAETE